MIILGLLLLAVAAVTAVELIVANDNAQITVHMWRWSWTVDAFWLAVAGAAILAVALLGLLMLKAGSGRERRLRRERRQLARENRELAKRAEVAEAAPARDAARTQDRGADAYAHPQTATPDSVAPTAAQPVHPEHARAPEPRYAGEPVDGRHVEHEVSPGRQVSDADKLE
ncbi:MAG: hypothetical protein ABI808_02475 [Pseudonocardiales bacterium]